jgi:hypothetical protein
LPVPFERIERRIFLIRGEKVMFDADLAELYQVPTKAFNQAVGRNETRFPGDFMFRLSLKEAKAMRSQFVTASKRNVRFRPYVFTEHGVAMLSSVLNSERAVQINILIIRAFVGLRELLATHKDLARKIEDLERKQKEQGMKIDAVFDALKKLLQPPAQAPRRRIGF